MVLSTTFALAQRHSRREMNGNNKITSFLAGMSCFPSERVVKVVVDYKKNNERWRGITIVNCQLSTEYRLCEPQVFFLCLLIIPNIIRVIAEGECAPRIREYPVRSRRLFSFRRWSAESLQSVVPSAYAE